MLLNIDDEELFENPDASVVRQAIETLELDAFAILSRKDEEYVQTYHNEDDTYLLEYRAGSYEHHYRATDGSLTNADIVDAFKAYMEDPENWAEGWQWERVEFDPDFEGGDMP